MESLLLAEAAVILPPGSTGADLQEAINNAVFGDIIEVSDVMPFESTVTIPNMLEVTIRSGEGKNWVLKAPVTPRIRHFEVDGSLILENITLDGGRVGGGVQLNQGNFSMNDGTIIRNCSAVDGGAVQVADGIFNINGGSIHNNTAQRGGGVYLAQGTFIMSEAGTIRRNSALLSGGGVHIDSDFVFSGGRIEENGSEMGGGIFVGAGALEMSMGIIAKNRAKENGGGMYISADGRAEVKANGALLNNRATEGNGGGIYTEDLTYANLTTESDTEFNGNRAVAAYSPPENAKDLYPNIDFAGVSTDIHPMNNYDINYTEGEAVTYRVTYNANGGHGGGTGPELAPGEKDRIFSPKRLGIHREGYHFVGWSTNADGSGDAYQPHEEIILIADVTLYAQWEKIYRPCHREFNCGCFCRQLCRDSLAHGERCYKRCCELCCKICERVKNCRG